MQLAKCAPITCIGLVSIFVAGSCNGPPAGNDDGQCDPLASECEDGQVCEVFTDGEHRCATAVIIMGLVQSLVDASPVEGALVQAVDINGAAAGTSAATDASGVFTLMVPAVRDDTGAPTVAIYTLRAQAAGFQEFPTAIRPALPIDTTSAVEGDDGWIIENALTTIGLISFPGDPSLLGSISGTVDAEFPGGVLIVAEGNAGAFVGYTDSEGAYTVFNVPAGSFTVQAYAAGLSTQSTNVSLGVGELLSDVELSESDEALSTVSGNVQIVNAPGGSITSVVLAVESTFVETTARGQVPPGLRIGDVTGAFSIPDVPPGRYVVLAAFENDNLVRDPDANISGTQIVHIEVPDPDSGNVIAISEGFKITEALAVVGPGADGPEQVSSLTPTFSWADDSSEDGDEVRVFDAFGTLVWETEIASVTGSAAIELAYAGPPLESGMFYQFRVTSFRERSGSRSAISTTEDLKGVFYFLLVPS